MDTREFLRSKDYNVIGKIGQGTYSSVYKAEILSSNIQTAIKVIPISKLTAKQIQNTLNEIRIICSIDHPNVVKYYDAFISNDNSLLFVVMEYLEGGDLSDRLSCLSKNNLNFDEEQIWKYSIQIMQGLFILHSHQTIHRDIKPANLFLTKDLQTVKIGDMNTSRIMSQEEQMAKTVIGTPYYLAPEIWLNQPYDYKCDVFSLGCVIYEMCMLKPPFRGSSVQELYNSVCDGTYSPLPNCFSLNLQNFIGSCLHRNPKSRSSILKLLKTDYIHEKLVLTKEHNILEEAENEVFDTSIFNSVKNPKSVTELKTALDRFRHMSQERMSRKSSRSFNKNNSLSNNLSSFESFTKIKKPSKKKKLSIKHARRNSYSFETNFNYSKIGKKNQKALIQDYKNIEKEIISSNKNSKGKLKKESKKNRNETSIDKRKESESENSKSNYISETDNKNCNNLKSTKDTSSTIVLKKKKLFAKKNFVEGDKKKNRFSSRNNFKTKECSLSFDISPNNSKIQNKKITLGDKRLISQKKNKSNNLKKEGDKKKKLVDEKNEDSKKKIKKNPVIKHNPTKLKKKNNVSNKNFGYFSENSKRNFGIKKPEAKINKRNSSKRNSNKNIVKEDSKYMNKFLDKQKFLNE